MNTSPVERTIQIFNQRGGVLTYTEALKLGVAPITLYSMVEKGILKKLTRGIYALSGKALEENTDLIIVSKKIKKAVICLISALHFHRLTTFIPREVYIALPRGSERPRLNFPPIKVFWFGEKTYKEGIETKISTYAAVKVYSVEKTIADCFKFRKKIGMDVALAALREGIRENRVDINNLVHYAKTEKVNNIIEPYLENLL